VAESHHQHSQKGDSDVTTTAAKPNSSKASTKATKTKTRGNHRKPDGLVRVAAGKYTIEKGGAAFTIEQQEGGRWHLIDPAGESNEEGYGSRQEAYEAL
jgi:hypothetical protein